jgi:hypothetical protein
MTDTVVTLGVAAVVLLPLAERLYVMWLCRMALRTGRGFRWRSGFMASVEVDPLPLAGSAGETDPPPAASDDSTAVLQLQLIDTRSKRDPLPQGMRDLSSAPTEPQAMLDSSVRVKFTETERCQEGEGPER